MALAWACRALCPDHVETQTFCRLFAAPDGSTNVCFVATPSSLWRLHAHRLLSFPAQRIVCKGALQLLKPLPAVCSPSSSARATCRVVLYHAFVVILTNMSRLWCKHGCKGPGQHGQLAAAAHFCPR